MAQPLPYRLMAVGCTWGRRKPTTSGTRCARSTCQPCQHRSMGLTAASANSAESSSPWKSLMQTKGALPRLGAAVGEKEKMGPYRWDHTQSSRGVFDTMFDTAASGAVVALQMLSTDEACAGHICHEHMQASCSGLSMQERLRALQSQQSCRKACWPLRQPADSSIWSSSGAFRVLLAC